MKKRNLFALSGACGLACVGAVALTLLPKSGILKAFTLSNAVWNHYTEQAPTPVDFGIKEYWVECGGNYQFTAPEAVTIVDKTERPDTSEFTDDDPRWNKVLADYNLGGGTTADIVGAYFTDGNTTYNEVGNQIKSAADAGYTHGKLEYNPYNASAENPNVWEIGLPRVNFAFRDCDLTVDFALVNWAGAGKYALTAEDLDTDKSFADNGQYAKLYASLNDGKLYVVMKYGETILNKVITDENVINGKASITLYTKHSNAGGNAFLGITNFDIANPLDNMHFGEWTLKQEATIGERGVRQMEDLLHGHVEEEFNFKATMSANDCASWSSGHVQLLVTNAATVPQGNYTLANKNDISIIHEGITRYPVGNLPSDLFTAGGTTNELNIQGGWFRYLFCGNWQDTFEQVFSDGDIVHFNATTFTSSDGVNCFDTEAFDLMLSQDDSTGSFHVYFLNGVLTINSLEIGGGTPWYGKSGLQFYTPHNAYLPVKADSGNQVGKYRGVKTSAIKVTRGGEVFNISKANDGWYDALCKEVDHEAQDRWYVNFGSGSIDMTSIGGAIQSGDIVTIGGLFIAPANNYRIGLETISVRYTLVEDVWHVEAV